MLFIGMSDLDIIFLRVRRGQGCKEVGRSRGERESQGKPERESKGERERERWSETRREMEGDGER